MAREFAEEYYANLAEGYRGNGIQLVPRLRWQASSVLTGSLLRDARFIGRLDSPTIGVHKISGAGSGWRRCRASSFITIRGDVFFSGAASALCVWQEAQTLDADGERCGTCGCGTNRSLAVIPRPRGGCSHRVVRPMNNRLQRLILNLETTPRRCGRRSCRRISFQNRRLWRWMTERGPTLLNTEWRRCRGLIMVIEFQRLCLSDRH